MVAGSRSNIGRFIPDHFDLTSDFILDQCNSFTYGGFYDGVNAGLDRNGQTFPVSGTITAKNSVNATTLNYTTASAFAKLASDGLSLLEYNISAGAFDAGRVNFSSSALSFANGVSTYADANSDYQFDTLKNAFNLRLDISALDSDLVVGPVVNSNAFEIRLGRLILQDSYGPELGDLEMRLRTEYFAGPNWASNSADNCSTYIDTIASFDAASYTDNLSGGETAIFNPSTLQNLTNGLSTIGNGFWFSAPGADDYGTVRVNLNLATQPWLQYDWNSDNVLDITSGQLSFGYYRGSDRVIYWREVRN